VANDKAAAIQKAQELAAQGRFDQGISQLRKLLDDSSNDANVYNAIGDLYLKQNSTAEAIQVFLDAARVFARDGFGIKAIAIFKKILKVDPGRAEIYTLQGDLNADRGLMSNAIADYLSGAKLYLKTGDSVRALDLYRKIIKLNPANMSVRLKAGELCLGQGLVEEALREYLAVANDYEKCGKDNEAHTLYELIIKHVPDHSDALRGLGRPLPQSSPVETNENSMSADSGKMVVTLTDEPATEAVISETSVKSHDSGIVEFHAESVKPEQDPVPSEEPPASLTEVQRLLAANEIEKAERMTRTLLLAEPDRSDYQSLLGLVYLKKGDAATAYDILYSIVKEWLAQGRKEAAIDLADAFLAMEPDQSDFLELRALASGAPVNGTAVGASSAADGPIESISEGLELAVSPTVVKASDRGADDVVMLEVVETGDGQPEISPESAKSVQTSIVSEAVPLAHPGQNGDSDYALGLAYTEMGLFDEAIEMFQALGSQSERYIDACAMAAVCHKSQQRRSEAIRLMERALGDSRCQGMSLIYVKYHLGLLYEEDGAMGKATQLYGSIPDILDASERLVRLQETASR